MSNCPSCHAVVEEASLTAGRCAYCGALLRNVPKRTVQDLGASGASKPDSSQDEDLLEELETLSPEQQDITETLQGPDAVPTLEFDPDDLADLEDLDNSSESKEKQTVAFSGEPTIEFPGPDEDDSEVAQKPRTVPMSAEPTIELSARDDDNVSESMVTAQWLDNVAGSQEDPGATIKQKETITGSFVSQSSLIVKPRHFRSKEEAGQPIVTAADAPDYELIDVIGEGGMGVVYAARQSAIARTVAVKMLKNGGEQTNEQREKFISEAVVTGELDHPNIVPIYDLGANDSGALFYSMKRVRGTPWSDVIKSTPLDENLSILLRAADAVAFAHANGVLHRDLKPENVMLGDFGEVLVMDWGLARISPDFPNAESVSQSDVMGGTPAYMAPEMATGPIDQITIASDVYLLGAILYEIIASRPPHTGKTVMACLFSAAKNKIVESEHAGELMDVALQAMATKPDDRYESVQQLQAAIRLYQSHSESVVLTDSAAKNLAVAQEADDYDLYSRSVYGFQEALSLWDGNRRARAMLSSAQLAYAESALGRGDFDLGISLLDSGSDEHRSALEKLKSGQRERESRAKRLKLLKGVVAALVAAVIGIVSVSLVVVRGERDKAVVARNQAVKSEAAAVAAKKEEEAAKNRAVDARNQAEKSEAVAVAAKKEEEAAKNRAVDARNQAEKSETAAVAAKKEEEAAKVRAEAARDRAIAAEQVAQQAKEDEEYEAYVARIGLASAKIEENAFDRASELLEECTPKLCHWEWGRLLHLCRLSLRTWRLDGPVEAVAFSPTGKVFASGDFDGKARLWDLDSGEVLHEFTHGQYVHAVAFDPAGKRLATGSSDHTIRIYDVSSGARLQTLAGHTDAVLTVRFSPDGKRLLSGGYDNKARLWDLATEEVLQTLQDHSWWVWAAEFSPDAQRIVTASQDGKAIVWEAAGDGTQYQRLTEFSKHDGPIYAAQFSPDGNHIATAGYDRRVLLWDPDQVLPVDIERRLEEQPDPPAPYQELTVHEGPVRSVVFSPDGQVLASGGQDNAVRIWDLAAGRETAVLRGHASHVRDCAFSPDGRMLLSAGRDQLIKLWQPDDYGEQLVLGANEAAGQAEAVLAARFSRDGSQVVTANRDRTAAVWDVDRRALTHRFVEGHAFLASSAEFFDDGARLATSAVDGTTLIWDVATGTEILQLSATGRTAALGVSSDGSLIVTGSNENHALVWDAHTGKQVAALAGHEAVITAAVFAPDSQLLATGDERGRCRLWRREGDAWVSTHQLQGHSRTIMAMAFTPDGRRLITASGDNTCGQWDVASGSELTQLVLKHPDWVSDMDVSEDGRFALTSCNDGVLRLWSLADARVVQTIKPESKVLFSSVDLSPDGRLAMAASEERGTVQMWQLASGREIYSDENKEQAWLDFGGQRGVIWAARFSPQGKNVLTIGGNDARLWDVSTRLSKMRFSPHGAVAAADISPDGKLLVTGSWDKSAKIWDIESGQAIRKLDGVHQGFVNSVEFSPDGAMILTGSDDGTARLWEVATGVATDVVFRHESRIRQACYSDDGRRVLTAANDKTARIWDADTGESQLTLAGHDWAVLCGEFSADGQRVVTGSEDNTAIVWDATSGEPLLKLAGHTDSVTSVAFTSDGARVLTGSRDNTAKLWDAHTGKEILTLAGHKEALTSVGFSPDDHFALTSGRDGATILWPAVDWNSPRERQAAIPAR